MSRPKPTVLLEFIDKKTYKSEQILDADAIWAVFFKNKPFNLKSSLFLAKTFECSLISFLHLWHYIDL